MSWERQEPPCFFQRQVPRIFPPSKISVEKAEKNVLFSLLFLNEDNYNFYRSSEDFRFFLSYK